MTWSENSMGSWRVRINGQLEYEMKSLTVENIKQTEVDSIVILCSFLNDSIKTLDKTNCKSYFDVSSSTNFNAFSKDFTVKIKLPVFTNETKQTLHIKTYFLQKYQLKDWTLDPLSCLMSENHIDWIEKYSNEIAEFFNHIIEVNNDDPNVMMLALSRSKKYNLNKLITLLKMGYFSEMENH